MYKCCCKVPRCNNLHAMLVTNVLHLLDQRAAELAHQRQGTLMNLPPVKDAAVQQGDATLHCLCHRLLHNGKRSADEMKLKSMHTMRGAATLQGCRVSGPQGAGGRSLESCRNSGRPSQTPHTHIAQISQPPC